MLSPTRTRLSPPAMFARSMRGSYAPGISFSFIVFFTNSSGIPQAFFQIPNSKQGIPNSTSTPCFSHFLEFSTSLLLSHSLSASLLPPLGLYPLSDQNMRPEHGSTAIAYVQSPENNCLLSFSADVSKGSTEYFKRKNP